MLQRNLLAACLFSLSALACADDAPPTPSTLKGGKVITVDEGQALAKSKGASFIDTRSTLNFGKGHVPGAVAIAYKEKSEKVENFDAAQDQFDFSKMPADKASKIVFYSDGPTGWKSYKAAVLSIKQGYTNVMYMRGGFAEWTAKNYPVER
ncbi:rhodanese-like domain-containing protein [Massilia sp. W12]|uniref:rhodanese-like domain-containing protein n=1 Tax=Massilia sp. W12 TaxID=3126507 RepID=UPI0030CDFAE3